MEGTEADFLNNVSDEFSESEFLDKSLSCWKGWSGLKNTPNEEFIPLPVDLHTASSLGQYDAVRDFIRGGVVNLNRKNMGGWTPLMYASYIGHDNVVNLLLECDVSVHTENNKGRTPLMLAASCGNESVCYFLLHHGADIEAKDKRSWTTLFHATYAGHQNVVRFLLENGANMEVREPVNSYTPLMMAACEGHEIIVQYYLEFGANMRVKGKDGNTARCLAMLSGFTKIVGLIDNHLLKGMSLRAEPGLVGDADFSSSDESFHSPRRHSYHKSKPKGPSITEGPEALARLINPASKQSGPSKVDTEAIVPQGYVTFEEGNAPTGELCFRDFTSPINAEDQLDTRQLYNPGESSHNSQDSAEADEEDNAFTLTGVSTIKSSSNSSGGLAAAFGLSRDSSADSLNEHFDNRAISLDQNSSSSSPTNKATTQKNYKGKTAKNVTIDERKNTHVEERLQTVSVRSRAPERSSVEGCSVADPDPQDGRPVELQQLIGELGLLKYLPLFEEQDVDLQVFLSLTDNDLKEVGIKLFGPRRKMTNAIARWHSNAPPACRTLEQTYADKLESEMQEMAIRLQKAYEEVNELKAQVMQEQQLRSVAEAYLMEHRLAWEPVMKLTTDTQTRCLQMKAILNNIRDLQEDMKTPRFRERDLETVVASLTLTDNKDPLKMLDKHCQELDREISLALLNTDKLLGKNMEYSQHTPEQH